MVLVNLVCIALAIYCIVVISKIFKSHKTALNSENFDGKYPNNSKRLLTVLALGILIATPVSLGRLAEEHLSVGEFMTQFIVSCITIAIVTLIIYQQQIKKIQTKRSQHQRNNAQANADILKADQVYKLTGFVRNESYLSVDKKLFIALDSSMEKVCIVDQYNTPHFFSKHDVIASEIIEDSKSISISDQYIAGGMISNIGVAMGTAITQQVKMVKEIYLKITVNDLSNATYFITFFQAQQFTSNKDATYVSALKKVYYWHDILCVLIKTAHLPKEDAGNRNVSANNSNISLADELDKLHLLKEKGVLTEEEFNFQKGKLLR